MSAEHAALRATAAEFVRREVVPHLQEWEDAGEIPRALHRTAPAYVARLTTLDRDTAACIGELPGEDRKLVTTHDALGYYAARYGLDVIGTVIPSQSTEGQPSAGDVADLIATIRATGVKAVFAESSVEPKVEEARKILEQLGKR